MLLYDFNEWSKQNFNDAKNLFKKIVDKIIVENGGDPENKNELEKSARTKPIGNDDLTDLRIMLETSKSIDDFIKQM